MIKSFDDIFYNLKKIEPMKLVVAAGEDQDVLESLLAARDKKIIHPIVTGNKAKISEIADKAGLDLTGVEIVETKDDEESVSKALSMIKSGEAELLMKGHIDTSKILRGVLDKKYDLKKENVLSHVALFEIRDFPRLLIISDVAMNIAPDLNQKHQIINNAVKFAHALGYDKPNVAIVCAVEKVNDKMPATVDAKELVDRNKKGLIKGCNISGPFALDNALSDHSAKVKNIKDPNAGKSDILIMPDIEAGNILFKALTYLSPSRLAGIIMGAKIPIVLTSRSDSAETKLNSIALGVYLAQTGKDTL
ncbi:bifunctional enoyl-CoA hydratase/phosphate acetyltransferase [Alkalibacter mobilis]|uniref:bifunctional enoyl-CoA hydratase/phosphate acetyltransferase n=1 Tax=Alkalibacter mobilis TaxID=2787712 RepID=UPI00189D8D6C|nr:bifunctional enoyl-CoA hydratase/phosphate acetyltransferase [Alkalibacter mobilis]MBF7097408.1 bifunctional enoyl-CoA hydratase/phosphate acetyltransferase [Alkalibacter mobilis]